MLIWSLNSFLHPDTKKKWRHDDWRLLIGKVKSKSVSHKRKHHLIPFNITSFYFIAMKYIYFFILDKKKKFLYWVV